VSNPVDFAAGFRGKYITRITRYEFDVSGDTVLLVPGNSLRFAISFWTNSGTTMVYPQDYGAPVNEFAIPDVGPLLFKESDQPGLPAYPWFGNDAGSQDITTIIETILQPGGGAPSAGKTSRLQDELTQQKPQSRLQQPPPLSSRMRTLARRLSSGRR
jgi:hypothetical protein